MVRHTVAERPVGRVVVVAEAPIPIAVPGIDDGNIVIAAAVRRTVESVDTRRVAVVYDDVFNAAIVGVGFGVAVVRRNVGVAVALRIVAVSLRIVSGAGGGGALLHCHHLSGGPHAVHIVDIYTRRRGGEQYGAGAEADGHHCESRKTRQGVYQCFHFNFLHALVCSTKSCNYNKTSREGFFVCLLC